MHASHLDKPNDVVHALQVLQTRFIDKTAQLQALQQELSGRRTPDPDIAALQHDMQEAQVCTTAAHKFLQKTSSP